MTSVKDSDWDSFCKRIGWQRSSGAADSSSLPDDYEDRLAEKVSANLQSAIEADERHSALRSSDDESDWPPFSERIHNVDAPIAALRADDDFEQSFKQTLADADFTDDAARELLGRELLGASSLKPALWAQSRRRTFNLPAMGVLVGTACLVATGVVSMAVRTSESVSRTYMGEETVRDGSVVVSDRTAMAPNHGEPFSEQSSSKDEMSPTQVVPTADDKEHDSLDTEQEPTPVPIYKDMRQHNEPSVEPPGLRMANHSSSKQQRAAIPHGRGAIVHTSLVQEEELPGGIFTDAPLAEDAAYNHVASSILVTSANGSGTLRKGDVAFQHGDRIGERVLSRPVVAHVMSSPGMSREAPRVWLSSTDSETQSLSQEAASAIGAKSSTSSTWAISESDKRWYGASFVGGSEPSGYLSGVGAVGQVDIAKAILAN